MKRQVVSVFVAAAMLITGHAMSAQNLPVPTYIPDIKFATGRNIAPYLEGWIKNADETFDFVFGYYNRNSEEELVIPAGPDNSVMPGGPDRGQPTYFLPKRQPRIFRVRVPKDWGDKTLTWSITANGKTEKVVAKLLPAEEINEHMMIAGGSNTMRFGEEDLNKPPKITLAPMASAAASTPLTLTATVVDDGLPKPPPPPKDPTVPQGVDGRFLAQRNSTGGARPNIGLRVNWIEYRGPGKVTFETNPIRVENGKAVTTARFAVPGTYILIAMANDGRLSDRTEVAITVK
jgi:hypothetical protein